MSKRVYIDEFTIKQVKEYGPGQYDLAFEDGMGLLVTLEEAPRVGDAVWLYHTGWVFTPTRVDINGVMVKFEK